MPKKSIFILCTFFGLLWGCGKEDFQPKPKAQLALTYEKATYEYFSIEDCPYQFEINSTTRIKKPKSNKACWVNIYYPNQKATIFITYNTISNNLEKYLTDAQKLPLQHTIKADQIEANLYENKQKSTYGTFYEVEGDAASQAQFYVTDSVQHFLTGSIYFEAKPNYDSILPAADYIKKDIRHIMETLSWK